jgi:hypothetical protein
MNQYFNLNRATNLCRRQLLINRHTLLVGVGAITAFMLGITILCTLFNISSTSQFNDWNFRIIFICGFIFTSMFFSEFRNTPKAMFYLSLPVSNFERLLVAWLLTSPILVIVSSLILYITNVLGVFIATGNYLNIQPFFTTEYFHSILNYMLIQPIFLFGSVVFKKNNFLKTVLSIIGTFVFLILYSMINARFILGSLGGAHNIHINFNQYSLIGNSLFLYSWILLLPFFLIVSYFKLKEKEI